MEEKKKNLNRTGQDRAEQNRTNQNRTESNKTKQNRTEHTVFSGSWWFLLVLGGHW